MDHKITQLDEYLFGVGRHYEIYEKLGAHIMTEDGRDGVYFAVWAPHAKQVSVVGDFNEWEPGRHPMKKLVKSGIFERFIPDIKKGDLYKFAVETDDGNILFKADPYGNYAQKRPDTASVESGTAHTAHPDSSDARS